LTVEAGMLVTAGASVRTYAISASASSCPRTRKFSYGIIGNSGRPSRETPSVMARSSSPSVQVPMAAGVMLGACRVATGRRKVMPPCPSRLRTGGAENRDQSRTTSQSLHPTTC
jgi:hypothetical protein